MSGVAAAAIVGGSVLTGYMGGEAQKEAAATAAQAQKKSSQAAIAEQQRQFDAIQELLRPYVEAGTGAIGGQQALLGLQGPEAQQQAISQLQQSPQFQAMMQQGEEAMLQNAAATGGLRGGNLQGALAQYRPQLLAQTIQQQLSGLGGLASLGQASAAGQAAAGQQSAANIGNLLSNIGQAKAGQALAAGQAQAGMYQGLGSSIGTLGTLKLLGAF